MTPTTSASPLTQTMQKLLSQRRSRSALRKLTLALPGSIDFSSNDFLSLSTSTELQNAYLRELQTNPEHFRLGSGGSRLLDGNSIYAEALENDIARFHSSSAGLLFNSGFDANCSVFAYIPQPGDIILYDEYIHASVHDGMKLSRAKKCLSFSHNSLLDLEAKLSELLRENTLISKGRCNVFVAIESLYSMDGDLAPIQQIVELVEKLLPLGNGHIIVDEAHSNGVYGPQGRGVVCELGLEDRIFIRLHTFGKALACNGAIVLCSSLTRSYLINYARPLIYSTSLSFPSLAAIKVIYSFIRQKSADTLRTHLNHLTSHFHHTLQTLNHLILPPHPQILQIPAQPPNSPIISLLSSRPRQLAQFLQTSGFMVRPIVPPTVPLGTQRVRICLHAGNTFDEVERLVVRIKEWLESAVRDESLGVGGEKGMNIGKSRL